MSDNLQEILKPHPDEKYGYLNGYLQHFPRKWVTFDDLQVGDLFFIDMEEPCFHGQRHLILSKTGDEIISTVYVDAKSYYGDLTGVYGGTLMSSKRGDQLIIHEGETMETWKAHVERRNREWGEEKVGVITS